jgi:hypothetical protein
MDCSMGGGASPRPLHRSAGQRREIRLPVRLTGMIVSGGEDMRVRVSDLSRGGARCHLPRPLSVGSALELRLDGLCKPAVVCWVSGTTCGLSFVGEIRATDLLIQSGKSSAIGCDGPDRSRIFVSANGQGRFAER